MHEQDFQSIDLTEDNNNQIPKNNRIEFTSLSHHLSTSEPSIDVAQARSTPTQCVRKREKFKREFDYHTSGTSINTRRFHSFAKWFTRIGFVAKAILYASIGIIAIVAATHARDNPSGPQRLFQQVRDSVGSIFLIVLVGGLFSYSLFGIFFGIFNVDQLPVTAGNVLKRFGRCVSALFYAVLGIDGLQIVTNLSTPDKQNNSEIVHRMFQSGFGRALLCVMAVVFFIVTVVYFYHFLSGAKFRCELATERIGRKRFLTFFTIARIGAVGRTLFFGTFGGAIIKSVKEFNDGKSTNNSILGLEAVLITASEFSHTFLFIVGSLLFVYAIWALILAVYRRLPAHSNQHQARMALGLNKVLASIGLPPVQTGVAKTRHQLRKDYQDTLDKYTIVKQPAIPLEKVSTTPTPNDELDLAERGALQGAADS